MSDKIEYNDLFADDAFKKGVEGVEMLVNAFKKLESELKVVATNQKEALSFNVNKSDDIKRLNDELAKTSKILNDLQNANNGVKQGEIELAKLRQEQQKAQQQTIKTEIEYQKLQKLSQGEKKKTLTLYQQESKLLRDLKNEYKNVALAQGQTSKAAQDLLAKITPLDAKLKQLDKTTGDNFRNVGNYSSALKGFGTAASNILGAAGISVSVGGVIGLGKAVIETRAEFQKFEAVLTNTLGSKSQAETALVKIQEFAAKTPFGVKELTEDFVKLANTGFKPTIKQMTALGDLASSQGKSFDQLTEALIDAQTGEFERLKEFGIRAKKEGDKVTLSFKDQKVQVDNNNESIRQAILNFGELEGVAGGMAAISETLGGKISNLNDNWDALLNNFGEQSEGAFGAVIDLFNELLGAANEAQTAINSVNKTLKQEGVEQSFFEKLSGSAAGVGVIIKPFVEDVKRAAEESNNFAKGINELQNAQTLLNTKYKTGAIDLRTYEIQNAILRDGIKDLTEGSSAYTKELNKQLTKTKELSKEEKKLAEQRAKESASDELKLRKQIEDFKVDSFTNEQQREEEKAKLDFERKKKEIENSKASQKTKNEALLALDLDYYNKRADIENKYNDKREADEKSKKDKEKKANDEAFEAAVKEAERLSAIEDEESEKQKAKEKKRKEDELKELADMAGKVLQIAEKEIKEKERLREQALDKEISDREKNIDRQRELADKGLANTLAFEEKALAEAERKKEDEAKKALKREKTLAFFKLFAANAEQDPNTALQKTIVETFLADAVAGSFFKGTEKVSEDLKGNKVHNGRDGYVVAVDGSERVLTGEQNKLIGKMTNEDLANLAYNYQSGLMPKYIYNDGFDFNASSKTIESTLSLSQLVSINKNLEELNYNIKNKKETDFAIDNLGNIVRSEIQNGLKKIETIKRGRI